MNPDDVLLCEFFRECQFERDCLHKKPHLSDEGYYCVGMCEYGQAEFTHCRPLPCVVIEEERELP